ncbi:hypothetical protein SPD79_13490, partial [Oceanobacillus sp. SE10311]
NTNDNDNCDTNQNNIFHIPFSDSFVFMLRNAVISALCFIEKVVFNFTLIGCHSPFFQTW